MSGATQEATEAFAARAMRRDIAAEGHFRRVGELALSTVGLGTYLGGHDEATDEAYLESIVEAARTSCNVLDTAINYRCQRSERVIGKALRRLKKLGVGREELVISTKGGFVPYDDVPPDDFDAFVQKEYLDSAVFRTGDMVHPPGHVMTPEFLRNQIERSLHNLGIDTIDIYYVHNPETQLVATDRASFTAKMRSVFETLEQCVVEGKIAYYGSATWTGHRVAADAPDFVSLAEIVALAEEVAGESHHFRFAQAPYNLAMTKCFTVQNHKVGDEEHSMCQIASALGVHLVSSASLAQGQLIQGLPEWLSKLFKGLDTDAQRSLQFARSTPGFVTALVGMRAVDHVHQNLDIARVPPVAVEDFMKLFEVDSAN